MDQQHGGIRSMYPRPQDGARHEHKIVVGNRGLRFAHQSSERKLGNKNDKILPYVNLTQRLYGRFKSVDFKHTPRAQNDFANALSLIAYMIQHPESTHIDLLAITLREEQAYYAYVEARPYGQPWYADIKAYLVKGEYPQRALQIKRRLSGDWPIASSRTKKYYRKRTLDLGLLRCVDAEEATKLLKEVDVGACGPHMNGFFLAKKILGIEYYWMTIEHDSCKFL
ncbi:uncharacterized protein LOC132619744 [Lycium barbarum]|uniref:uncharacterized protein LOC132619744 n=1 Tax=Lycium barbarum TaxID=112863 RepID=UPI00293F5862|nr:uncharacterized protein LOC132619744 [Lycium barbarum]